MLFKLVFIKRSKVFVIGFSTLFLIEHIPNNSSKPVFHPEQEDKISSLSTLSANLETLILLSSSEIYISWKGWSSFSVFLLLLFFTNFRNFFQFERLAPCCSFCRSWNFSFFLLALVDHSTKILAIIRRMTAFAV